MVLPVFTGVKPFIDQPNWAPPIDAYEAKGYLLGTQIAKNQPSTITAAVEGLQKGLEQKQAAERNSAEIEKLRMEAEMFPESEQARINANNAAAVLAQTRAENEADPNSPENRLRLAQTAEAEAKVEQLPAEKEILRLQQQAAIAKSRTELLKAQNEAGKYARENQDNEFREQQKFNLGEVTSVIGSPNQDPEDLIDILHKDVGKIVRAATPLNSKENIVDRDTDVDTLVDGFVDRIRDTYPNQQDIIDRAEEFRAAYSLGVNRRIDATNKQKTPTPLAAATGPSELQTLAQQVGGAAAVAPAPTTGAPPAKPAAAAPATPATSGSEAAAKAIWPERLSVPAPAIYGETTINEEDKPVIDRIFDAGVLPHTAERKEKAKQRYIAEGFSPKEAEDKADENIKNSRMTAKESEGYEALVKSISQTREKAQRARAALDKIRAIEAASGEGSPLGPGEGFRRLRIKAWAYSPVLGGKDKELSDAIAELDAIGGIGTLQTVNEMGFASQVINVESEQKRYGAANFTSEASVPRNQEVLELYEARVQEMSDMQHIIDVLMSPIEGLNYSYQEAFKEANRYRNLYPNTVSGSMLLRNPDGSVREENIVVRNQAKPTAGEYLDKRLGLSRAAAAPAETAPAETAPAETEMRRTGEGRATAADEAQVDDVIKSLPKSITEAPSVVKPDMLSRLDSFLVSEAKADIVPGTDYDLMPALDIPQRMYKGNVALFNRMIWFESQGKIGAKSPKDAEGLMQLLPSTGAEVWRKSGYEAKYGPYNPKDPILNVTMGMKYMNSMLTQFDGNVRVALAAYNSGPYSETTKKISKAYRDAEEFYGTKNGMVEWEKVKRFLPAGVAEETSKYIANIMGDNEPKTPRTPKPPKPDEYQSAVDSMPTESAKLTFAASGTPEAVRALNKVAQVNTFKDAMGTELEGPLRLLLSAATETSILKVADPLGVSSPEVLAQVPESIQPFAMGLARALAYGFDEEAGAAFRMLVLGEDWKTAIAKAKLIRAQIEAEHPKTYFGGVGLGALSPYNAGAGVIRLAAPVVRGGVSLAKTAVGLLGSAKGSQIVSQAAAPAAKLVEEAPGFFRGAAQTAKSVAPHTFIFGAGETEGGIGERIKGGIDATLKWTAPLSMLGGFGSLATKTAQTKAVHEVAIALKDAAGGAAPTKLSPAAVDIFARLQDMSPAGAKKIIEAMRNSNHEAASLVEHIDEGTLLSAVEALSNQPNIARGMRKWAGTMLDRRNARVEDLLDQAGIVEKNPANAFDNLTKETLAAKGELKTARRTGADIDYEQNLRPSLTTVLPRSPQGKIIGPKTGAFVSQEVRDVIKQEPWVAKNLSEAQMDEVINPTGKLPITALNVVQEGFARMENAIKGMTPTKAKLARDAFNKFKAAVYKESPLFEKAQGNYSTASDAMTAFQSKAEQVIEKFSNPKEITNIDTLGEKIAASDPRTLKDLHDSLGTPARQQALRDAFGGWIMNQFKKLGDREWGKGQRFPAILRKGIEEKMAAIGFTPAQIKTFAEGMDMEGRVSTKLNRIMEIGSQTQPRGLEQQRLFEIAEQASDAMVSVGAYGMAGGAGRTGRASWKIWDKFRSMFGSDDKAKEFARILSDKKAGIQTMEQIREHLVRKKVDAVTIKHWDEWMKWAQKNLVKGSRTAARIGIPFEDYPKHPTAQKKTFP